MSLWVPALFFESMMVLDEMPGDLLKFRERFAAFETSETFSYIVHSMRFCTFGPHHYVMIFKMLLDEE